MASFFKTFLVSLKARSAQSWITIILIATGILLVLGTAAWWIFKKKKPGDTAPALPIRTLVSIKDEISNANMEAAIEIATAKAENTWVKTELKEINKEPVPAKRRERLIDLYRRSR